MLRQKVTIILLIFLFLNVPNLCQGQTSIRNLPNKMTLGLNLGTGLFQNIKMDLVNFDQEILVTSDNLVPTTFKANFNYYITPNVAVRFSSGYGFTRQTYSDKSDFRNIDDLDIILTDEAIFTMDGFPLETALIFQTAVDKNQNISVYIGLGFGYYAYNFKAKGTFNYTEFVNAAEPDTIKWEENYLNPEMSLSGVAQFFVLGLNINLGQNFGASFEISKIGLSYMRLKSDIIKQEIAGHNVTYEVKYGSRRHDYKKKNGLDDVAITAGIFWRL